MSKKPEVIERPLTDRIAKARREERTQQALELTRQLVKYEPTEKHRELLRQVTLERGQDLQARGQVRDAATVYTNLLTMGGPAEFLALVAQRLAGCGAVAPALAALAQLPDPALRQRILQNTIDAAIAQGAAGKTPLPPELHAPFDLIVQAFADCEAGRDEQARTRLQGIGLQSPFLEWKVLLRGLLAFYAKDDVRALENWQRLDPARLPSRLCAPMRAGIDAAFLASQPPAVQQVLRAKMMQQQGIPLAPLLKDLRDLLNSEKLAQAFRKAEQIAPVLRRDYPVLWSRFSQCLYWAIIDHGDPEDVERFLRVFGFPADDPRVSRLQALALEARGMWPEAHKAWQEFIEDIAKNPDLWPGESAQRAQAIIWTHMAENAGPQRKRSRSANPFFDLFASRSAPLKPSSEQCYENAIKLAPDRLDSYRALFNLYFSTGKVAKAKKIGQQLLKRFPDHADTMTALGELCMASKDFKKAQDYFQKAIHANPLDRSLRADLARAKQNYGLTLTLAGKYDEARAQYQQAVQLWNGSKTSLLCQWAVAEMKANQRARADELIAQAQAEPDHRLACCYALVGESVRAKLPVKDKKQIAADLKAALAQTPSPAEILVLLESAAHQRRTHDDAFHGQKTQEKMVLKFFNGIHFNAFDEGQLIRLCKGLQTLGARKPWYKCLRYTRYYYAENPFFRLSFADYYLQDARNPNVNMAGEYLDQARRLVEQMPRGEEQQQYLEQIKEREDAVKEIRALGSSLEAMMDHMFGGMDGDDDFEDDDEEDAFW